jgi:hypothetical protein
MVAPSVLYITARPFNHNTITRLVRWLYVAIE